MNNIIDKVISYQTEEETKRLEVIQLEQDSLLKKYSKQYKTGNYDQDLLTRVADLEEEARKIHSNIEARYIKASSKKTILEDIKEIVSSIERENFIAIITERNNQIASLRASGSDEESLLILKDIATEDYKNCYNFILWNLRVQLNALANDEASTEKALDIVKSRVSLWYVQQHPDFFPLAHGKATDALAFMSTRTAELDDITGNGTIDKFGVQLTILKLKELHATLGISTDKLLTTALATFTQQNDFRHTKTKEPKREVTLNLKEYAALLGYDVEERETSTPEEAERERKRAKDQLDNARKVIKKDLDIIHASTLTWKEPIKGNARDFDRISLVTRTAIKNGEIKISFSPEIAVYLSERNLITQYPTKLLRISGRQPNAYYIGRKLSEHYNMDSNQTRGTHDRISIPSVLAVTELPTYEEVMKQDRHWERRIKDALEQALDTLTQEGVLKDWEYTHAKGVPLTDEEAIDITSYEEFTKLYLHFTPAEKVDHTERIEAKQEARKKRTTTRKKTKRGK